MMDFILFWVVVGCVVLFALGVFGVLVPGPQWWRASRGQAGMVCLVSFFCAFVAISIASRDTSSDPFDHAIRHQDVPDNAQLRLIAYQDRLRRVVVGLDGVLPPKTRLHVSIERRYREVGNPERYSVEYFSEWSTFNDWTESRAIILNHRQWEQDLRAHQAEMARISPLTAFEVGKIEDDVVVSVVVPGTDFLDRQVRVPFPLTGNQTSSRPHPKRDRAPLIDTMGQEARSR